MHGQLINEKKRPFLKKCAPAMRSCEAVFWPIKSKSIVEVFVASTQFELQYFSRSQNICCFSETSSITACQRQGFKRNILVQILVV